MTYTIEQIKEIRLLVEQLELYAGDEIMSLDIAIWQEQCNGIGADWFSESLRKKLTRLYKLPLTTAIHDLMYYLSNGTRRMQKIVDVLFYLNGKIEIKYNWAWYKPYRYWQFIKLRLAYSALKIGGYTAYKAAYEKYN